MTDRMRNLIFLWLFVIPPLAWAMALWVQADTPAPCEPPCYGMVITTNPASYECWCPPGEVNFDGTGTHGTLEGDIRLDPHSNNKGWEIRTDDEWICVRRRGDD